MPPRKALLVGSLPYADEHEAMTRALAQFGSRLIALPDGEIGEKSELYPTGTRAAWVLQGLWFELPVSKRKVAR